MNSDLDPILLVAAIFAAIGVFGLLCYPALAARMDARMARSKLFSRLTKPFLIGGSYQSTFQQNQAKVLSWLALMVGAALFLRFVMLSVLARR